MIGVFDSGVGGLTVVRALMDVLPHADFLYFGDTARTPYGNKSRETIVRYAFENTRLLVDHGATRVVVACNSAASAAQQDIQARFDLPVFDVIGPAVSAAVSASPGGAIGVIGTRATIGTGIYERRIQALRPNARVVSQACPLLVPLVEEGWLDKPETARIVRKYLHPLRVRQIDTLILGCTHYPLLRPVIQRKIGRRVRIIDSALAVAERVAADIAGHPAADAPVGKPRVQVMVSDVAPQFARLASRVLKQPVTLLQAPAR